GRDDKISAFASCFGHRVTDIVDDIGIVALAAGHYVSTEPAIQRVVAVQAGQRVLTRTTGDVVVGITTGEVPSECTGIDVILDIVDRAAKDHRASDGVVACVHFFDDLIAGIVDIVSVITQTTGHDVDAGATIDDVVAVIAGQGVAQSITGEIEIVIAGQGDILNFLAGKDTSGKIDRDTGDDRVVALLGRFDHFVADIVNKVGVVTKAADQNISTGTTVERVFAATAGDDVVE